MGRKRRHFGTKAEYMNEYRTRAVYRESLKERRKRPDEKEYNREYLKRPEVKSRYQERNRERGKINQRLKRADPEHLKAVKEYEKRPGVKERRNYLKRWHRSGLPIEVFETLELTKKLQRTIRERLKQIE